jgi:hypothetical protein
MAGPSIMVRVLGDVTGLGKSFDAAGSKGQSAGDKMHSAFRGVLDQLNASGVLGPFGAALAGADEAISKISGHGKEIPAVMMGVGAAVTGVGLALQAAGSKDQAAQQQLKAAVEATGKSYDDYGSRVDEVVKKQERYGTTADQTKDALRKLTQATNDPAKALDMIGTAADLAAAKHEDLSTASGQLAKAVNGSGRILKEFGITTKDTTGKQKDQSQILSELSAKLSGQASASADTFTGKLKGMKASIEDHIALIGEKYGPAITTAGVAMTGLGAALQIATALTESHTVATVAHTVATYAQTAAQWALNIAMSANPIMIVVLALAVLVGAVILAYKNFDSFRVAVNAAGAAALAVFNAIRTGAVAVFNWIAQNWPLLVAILAGPFGLAVFEIAKHWDSIVSLAASIPGRIVGALGNVGNLLFDAGKSIIDGLGRGIESALTGVLDKVGGIAGKIASLKGPLDRDRALLVPAGTAIMAGLRDSLASGMGDVERLVGGAAPRISAAAAPAAEAGPVTPVRSGPAVVIQNANFTTDYDVDAFMSRVAWAAKVSSL